MFLHFLYRSIKKATWSRKSSPPWRTSRMESLRSFSLPRWTFPCQSLSTTSMYVHLYAHDSLVVWEERRHCHDQLTLWQTLFWQPLWGMYFCEHQVSFFGFVLFFINSTNSKNKQTIKVTNRARGCQRLIQRHLICSWSIAPPSKGYRYPYKHCSIARTSYRQT